MHTSVFHFVSRVATAERIAGKRVLEVGSYNVNGSARDILLPHQPAEYIGIDQQEQAGYVDVVLDAGKIAEYFGKESFDVVVSTEMLEHAEHWEEAISAMRDVLKPGGLLILTARGPGFPLHSYPWDFWRFTTDDIAAVLGDFHVLYLGDDEKQSPGFLYAAFKPPCWMTARPWPMNAPLAVPLTDAPAANDGWQAEQDPVAFYHVAGMGHWKEIVAEQLSLLHRAKFTGRVHIGFLGQPFEDGFIARVAGALGLNFEVRHFGSDMHQYEFPTLAWCHEFCQTSPERPVLYFHGKAVSNTRWQWTMWRWIMNAYCLTQWKTMASVLRDHNCAGVSWVAKAFPVAYFPGNFWWARSSFVRGLTEIHEYIRQFNECIQVNNPDRFTTRHAAECWFNSKISAEPFIAGPRQSRFWDHEWWTAEENDHWCEMAYQHGH